MVLLAPDPRRIADPPAQAPADDRVPDAVAGGTPEPLRADLVALLGERVLHRTSDLVAYASDASPYRLIPKAVVMAHDAEDVRRVLDYGRRTGTPVTLRSGGTSLNGQGQGDGILADEHTAGRQRLALDVARRYAGVERRARAALRTPPGLARTLADAARSVVSDEVVPTWPEAMPPPAPARLPATRRDNWGCSRRPERRTDRSCSSSTR